MPPELLYRATASALTLYMLLILLRWFGPWLSLDVEHGSMRWISRLTDPLITRLRRVVPPLGPADFGPLAALLLVWLVRELSLGVLRSYLSA